MFLTTYLMRLHKVPSCPPCGFFLFDLEIPLTRGPARATRNAVIFISQLPEELEKRFWCRFGGF